MTINLVACVVPYKNKLAIGRNNDLIVRLKEDMMFFKNLTSNNLSSDSKLPQNIVLMGRKTWFSIPSEYRPLKNRLNLVLTNDKDLLKLSPYSNFSKENVQSYYFITYKEFLDFYNKFNPNVFVIGGNEIYNLFLNNSMIKMKPQNVFLTEVYNYKIKDGLEPDTFMSPLGETYKLIGVSELKKDKDLNFRFLTYKNYPDYKSEENKYIELIKYILENGKERPDRTGVGTFSIFGAQMKFDISQSIPLLTSKRIPFKAIVEELLFFINGHTDVNILQDKGVKIWNGNTTREFLDARNLQHYKPGIMGPMYGWQWRFFGAPYSQAFADTTNLDYSKVGGFDQLTHVEKLLKTDPYSRRIYISNLNPLQSSQMVLEPCHCYLQLYVTETNGQKYLSGYFTMRSSDSLAWCYNIVSYTILIYILALKCDMKPKEIIYNSVDCHIYKTHIEQIKKQISRPLRPFPKIILDNSVKNKDWNQITFKDISLIGYFPHPGIKMDMAV